MNSDQLPQPQSNPTKIVSVNPLQRQEPSPHKKDIRVIPLEIEQFKLYTRSLQNTIRVKQNLKKREDSLKEEWKKLEDAKKDLSKSQEKLQRQQDFCWNEKHTRTALFVFLVFFMLRFLLANVSLIKKVEQPLIPEDQKTCAIRRPDYLFGLISSQNSQKKQAYIYEAVFEKENFNLDEYEDFPPADEGVWRRHEDIKKYERVDYPADMRRRKEAKNQTAKWGRSQRSMKL